MIAALEERLASRDLRGKGLEGKGDAEWKKSHKQKRGAFIVLLPKA